ncbi:MAG: class I adenylate-forming enzyme family protein [Myxococcaceae bacterium]
MDCSWLIERLQASRDDTAIVWRDSQTSYRTLLEHVQRWRVQLDQQSVSAGSVVAIDGSFSPQCCAALIALVERGAIAVPLTSLMRNQREASLRIAEAQVLYEFDDQDQFTVQTFLDRKVTHPLTLKLIARGSPGLMIFSSGSTGEPKAVLHDFARILEKFRKRTQKKITLTFLLFDHIGGIDTLFNTLSSGGTMVTVPVRDAEAVAAAIAKHRVHTLPVSPTFLNLLLISGVATEHDLSSLRVIAYGTEPMPAATLQRLRQTFPNVALVQTYGMSETGVLRSKSKDSGSLWIKFTHEGFETKVVDGTLWIRCDTAMLGYLNAPDLFNADGWLNTQDKVEVDGEYVRILGRASDLINVGGQKVYPAEVESALLMMPGVEDVTVFGKQHPMMGQVVAARFTLAQAEPLPDFKRRMSAFAREHLARHQTPIFVELVDSTEVGARFKKRRRE